MTTQPEVIGRPPGGNRGPVLFGAAMLALAVFATGTLAIDLLRLGDNVAAIWLSNALALAVILQRPPRDWGLYAGATAAGNLAMGLLHGDGWPLLLGIAGCNVGEVMIAATLLRLCRATDILGSLRSLLLFFGLAVGVSTGLSAAAGALLVSSLFS